MTEKKAKRLNRAQRLLRLLGSGWSESWEQSHTVGSVSISKVRSEVRAMGHDIERRWNGQRYEYRVAR